MRRAYLLPFPLVLAVPGSALAQNDTIVGQPVSMRIPMSKTRFDQGGARESRSGLLLPYRAQARNMSFSDQYLLLR
jgi:hypothetical protein